MSENHAEADRERRAPHVWLGQAVARERPVVHSEFICG